jgi:hypothetical protein
MMVCMCIMCEGGSRDDVSLSIHRRLERYGSALQRVEVQPPGLPWTYTVGLLDRHEHAELVVIGGSMDLHRHVLNGAIEQIDRGRRFDPGDERVVDGLTVGVGEVHPHHLSNGLIATWVEYYAGFVHRVPPLEVVQLVLPDGRGCHRHQTVAPLLADPLASWEAGVARGPDRLDRAERRRRQRADVKREAIAQRHFN